ncbi:hypothetical protein HanRHA438_Chr12g0539601 [Helianthus annuus]|nr:hypothetical protein HanRHA438_Chr12g0539601 [Helianthus annuus]
MYRMVKTTDRAPASSGQFIFAKTLHPGIIMMICYLTFVTHEPKNDQLKDRGRSRFYQEKYYQYGAILQGVKYIENEQCSRRDIAWRGDTTCRNGVKAFELIPPLTISIEPSKPYIEPLRSWVFPPKAEKWHNTEMALLLLRFRNFSVSRQLFQMNVQKNCNNFL